MLSPDLLGLSQGDGSNQVKVEGLELKGSGAQVDAASASRTRHWVPCLPIFYFNIKMA